MSRHMPALATLFMIGLSILTWPVAELKAQLDCGRPAMGRAGQELRDRQELGAPRRCEPGRPSPEDPAWKTSAPARPQLTLLSRSCPGVATWGLRALTADAPPTPAAP